LGGEKSVKGGEGYEEWVLLYQTMPQRKTLEDKQAGERESQSKVGEKERGSVLLVAVLWEDGG
jgi:hypothetical protein